MTLPLAVRIESWIVTAACEVGRTTESVEVESTGSDSAFASMSMSAARIVAPVIVTEASAVTAPNESSVLWVSDAMHRDRARTGVDRDAGTHRDHFGVEHEVRARDQQVARDDDRVASSAAADRERAGRRRKVLRLECRPADRDLAREGRLVVADRERVVGRAGRRSVMSRADEPGGLHAVVRDRRAAVADVPECGPLAVLTSGALLPSTPRLSKPPGPPSTTPAIEPPCWKTNVSSLSAAPTRLAKPLNRDAVHVAGTRAGDRSTLRSPKARAASPRRPP